MDDTGGRGQREDAVKGDLFGARGNQKKKFNFHLRARHVDYTYTVVNTGILYVYTRVPNMCS